MERQLDVQVLKNTHKTDAEIKRVWVQPEFRGKHIASDMMS